jgi:hypothetical protein
MINLYRDSPTNTFAVYPDVTSSYANNELARFSFTLTQDYDQSVTEFTGSLINTPTDYNPRLIFQVTGSALPDWSGLYTLTLEESLDVGLKWGEANIKWSEANTKWSAKEFIISQSLVDLDRAKVSGSDAIIFQQYQGPNETGAYSTYHL